jgi:hypothetical protein
VRSKCSTKRRATISLMISSALRTRLRGLETLCEGERGGRLGRRGKLARPSAIKPSSHGQFGAVLANFVD